MAEKTRAQLTAELERREQEHANELARARQAHAAELERIRTEAAREQAELAARNDAGSTPTPAPTAVDDRVSSPQSAADDDEPSPVDARRLDGVAVAVESRYVGSWVAYDVRDQVTNERLRGRGIVVEDTPAGLSVVPLVPLGVYISPDDVEVL